jgi:hypothetical protein
MYMYIYIYVYVYIDHCVLSYLLLSDSVLDSDQCITIRKIKKKPTQFRKSVPCYNIKVQNIYIYNFNENQNNINQNINFMKFTVNNLYASVQ